VSAARKVTIFGASVLFLVSLLIAAYLSRDYWPVDPNATPTKITCINNLKQIGLGMRTWALDHGDQFCFNLSTNQEGTLEFCAPDKDGFDRNSALHFRAMSSDLTLPVILVCPKDRSKRPATDFGSLQASNVTYRLRSGRNIKPANPAELVAVCPIDGNTLFSDGTVAEGKKR
jgi:hypothetical protein